MTEGPKPGTTPASEPSGAPEPRARVVVCEDDTITLELLCDHLAADGFAVLPAASAADALRLCRLGVPDLLLLDLGLPDASGLEVLRAIREGEGPGADLDSEMAVIVLSGRGAEAERIRGLQSGADDYIVKPFSYAELQARIDAVLRRRAGRDDGALRVGDLLVDPARRSVSVGAREVALCRKEFALLVVLASDPTRVFAKQELLESVWGPGTEDRTRTVDSHASRLRRKLDPDGRRFVINCWGIGYRLCERAELEPGAASPSA